MTTLIFDLINPDGTYAPGTAEALWQELKSRYNNNIVSIYSRHLSRYTNSMANTELFKELNDYGPLGQSAARFITGYIGMAQNIPPIEPEAWTRVEAKRDQYGRFVSYTKLKV